MLSAVQGAPAYSNYGFKSNEELILGYGFMLEDNPADFYHVSLGLHAQTEHGAPHMPCRGPPGSPILISIHNPEHEGGLVPEKHPQVVEEDK